LLENSKGEGKISHRLRAKEGWKRGVGLNLKEGKGTLNGSVKETSQTRANQERGDLDRQNQKKGRASV